MQLVKRLRMINNKSIIDAIKAVPEVIPHLRGRAWWIGLGIVEQKTFDYFLRVLAKAIRDLYAGKITEAEFVDILAGYVERQIRRAWNEGMRLNGLDPRKDMTAEWEQIYQNLVTQEYQYIDRLAAQIVERSE